MRFHIFTLFPNFFHGPFSESILKRAQEKELIEIGVHDVRAWTTDKHHVCDDTPYGGGAGMLMKAEPLARAVEDVLKWDAGHALNERSAPPCPIVFLTPGGRTFNQRVAEEFAGHARIAFVCGHYEGVDERAIERLCTDELSLGDFVLTGGEAAAVVVVEAVARLVPGVLGNAESAQSESFSHAGASGAGLLEAPHYTRPAQWRGQEVPEVLLSGHHGEVEKWRFRQGLRRTMQRRPDLIAQIEREGWTKWQQKIWAEETALFEED